MTGGKHKKPTGRIGPVRVSGASGPVELDWEEIGFPDDKESIEHFVIQHFVAAGSKGGFKFESVIQNEENHFNFTLTLPGGKVFMDLMELMYRDGDDAGSCMVHNPGYDFNDDILTLGARYWSRLVETQLAK